MLAARCVSVDLPRLTDTQRTGGDDSVILFRLPQCMGMAVLLWAVGLT